VVNQTHTRIVVSKLGYLFARTIVAHTIRDDDLESEGGIILSQHGLQPWNNRSRCATDRHDDAYGLLVALTGASDGRGSGQSMRTAAQVRGGLRSSGEKPGKSH